MTLIEVSLSLSVMAAGVLGAAGLQLRALQASEQARQHSQAVWLAHSLLETGRAVQTLSSPQLDAWQSQLEAALGQDAEGRVQRAGQGVEVRVQWSGAKMDAPQSVVLQGRVAP